MSESARRAEPGAGEPLAELPEEVAPESTPEGGRVVVFAPGSTTLPADIQPMLAELIERARAEDVRIHVIGEADRPHLALARAREVGLALVQLGATADLIEFDIADSGAADRVSLVLK
jgi:hypothetical protein